MAETIGIEALAAAGGCMPAHITLIGGWTYWLVRDSERNLRREMERNTTGRCSTCSEATLTARATPLLCSVSTRNREIRLPRESSTKPGD